jgi:excisionase family DNA binding protein
VEGRQITTGFFELGRPLSRVAGDPTCRRACLWHDRGVKRWRRILGLVGPVEDESLISKSEPADSRAPLVIDGDGPHGAAELTPFRAHGRHRRLLGWTLRVSAVLAVVTVYRVTEAAEMLGLSRSKVYVLIQSGVLPSVRFDGSRRIRAEDLGTYVAALSSAA